MNQSVPRGPTEATSGSPDGLTDKDSGGEVAPGLVKAGWRPGEGERIIT